MKIAIDARTMGAKPSGIGMYLYDFLRVLGPMEEFEFTLITDVATSEYMQSCSDMGMKIVTLGKEIRSREIFSYFDFIQSVLDREKPDIFWEVNNLIPKKLYGNFKKVVTIHDMFPITHTKYVGRFYGLYFKRYMKKTIESVDYIIYNSYETKHETAKVFPAVRKINSCVSYIVANKLRVKPAVSDKGYLLYVGNLEMRKGTDILLDAYEEYKKRGGNKRLILAGKIQEKWVHNKLTETTSRVDGIKYYNYVSHENKHKLYANCSCFVFPSRAEGFGMPVIEVMKFDKPIITADLSIYDEIVGDVINRYTANGSHNAQVRALADTMLNYDEKVDTEAYLDVLDRYSPEKLGGKIKKFLMMVKEKK